MPGRTPGHDNESEDQALALSMADWSEAIYALLVYVAAGEAGVASRGAVSSMVELPGGWSAKESAPGLDPATA